MSIIHNIDTNQTNKLHHNETMPAFIAEILSMAGAFTVLFSILFCCIKADKEDSYTRQMRRLRNYKCKCSKCGNNGNNGKNGKHGKIRSGSKTR